MNKFWLNEKIIVFLAIILLLIFLGLIFIFSFWVKETTPKPELSQIRSCLSQEEEVDREELMEKLIYLEGLLAKLDGTDITECALDSSSETDATCASDLSDELDANGCIPTHYSVYVEMGRTYYQLEEYQKSKEFLLNALSEHEDDFVYSLLADNEWLAGHYSQSKKYMLKAIDYRPEEYDHWDRLIRLERDYLKADFNKLNSIYASAAEAVQTERAYSSYAYFLEDLEKYDQAAQVWSDFLIVNPSQEEYYRPRVEWLESKI